MHAMHERLDPAELRRLQLRLRHVLRALDPQHAAEQAPGGGDVGGDCALSRLTWPGRDFGVRGPGLDETPLSWDEARLALTAGLVGLPMPGHLGAVGDTL